MDLTQEQIEDICKRFTAKSSEIGSINGSWMGSFWFTSVFKRRVYTAMAIPFNRIPLVIEKQELLESEVLKWRLEKGF